MSRGIRLLPISFTTLLWSYISGCIVASTLCAILAVVVRRRQRLKKCVHGGFNPGYSAWTGTRYSLPASSAATSSCYFNSPSLDSCEDDGLVVTINGIDGNHSVVDRPSISGGSGNGFGGGSCGGGSGGMSGDQNGFGCGATLGGTFGRGGGGRGGASVCGGGDGGYPTHGRCSTVSSFRRHLPANYIVTNTEMGDDFFFHF